MNIINVENITKTYTERELFSEASCYVQERVRIGIVGINGTGKSTLLRILAGASEPDSGTVTFANHIVCNYLSQNPDFDPEEGILDAVMSKIPESQRWTLESEAKSMLMKLEITDFHQKTGELSGGQRKRLALVAALIPPCDVLLLDEPTNHLDYPMVEWLEDYLRSFKGAIIMVTHDRYFLDSVCNRIVEIDKGNIYSYECNYSGFLERKAAREESLVASERKRQSVLRKEIAWMQRGARARSTKQKAHIQRYEALRDQKGIQVEEKLALSSMSQRLGRTTVEVLDLNKAYGDKTLIKDFTYIFLKNDRVAFVGKNGCGKTTLMKMIGGMVQADSGEVVIGQTVKLGYYAQELSYMDPNQRVIDYIKDTAEYVRTEDGLVSASAMLERFLFPASQQYSAIGKLSGGEQRRLNLLKVLMEAPNVLILDEPTNDLDTETMAILEDYLDGYQGIVISVSHDRYFLDRTMNRIFAFRTDGTLKQYEGGYTDYLHARESEPDDGDSLGSIVAERTGKAEIDEGDLGQKKVDSKATWGHAKKLKFTYQEQKDYEVIEQEIESLEEKLEELDADMVRFARDFVKLNELTKEKEQTESLLEEKMQRWEYLEDLAMQIENQ